MTESLRHRGPDASACVCLPDCHLGHTRLSVIDLAGGGQPMTEETERYWIVFNGEIYNYRELRSELEQKGWQFRTRSDTEVLLRAYQEFGQQVPGHLNGQFAFVIWDQTERRLFAARDRLGEKPLYWARSDQGHFLFASEIKSLLASGLVQPRIDRTSVDAYLALLYVPPDRTIYENVHDLRPGHALSWQDGDWRQGSYWQPSYSQSIISDRDEAVERLCFLIDQAVRRQMVADVPLGAFLSGGLDSSTIVALMTRQTSQQISTFSVGFGDLINELPYARAVAEAYTTDHHEMQMDIPVGEMLERMAEAYDEPFGDSSNIPTYLICEFARRHVKVVLSGDGGDELFGGYEWYQRLVDDNAGDASGRRLALLKLTAFAWRALSKAGLSVQLERDSAVSAYTEACNKRRFPDLWERHLAYATDLKVDRSFWGNGQSPLDTEAAIRKVYGPEVNVKGIDRVTDFDLRCYLPGDILVKVDRAAMAHGLESRAPFLDVDLVEFVLGLPWAWRFRKGDLKGLLRETCRTLWPKVVQERSKQGFGAPIWSWVQRPDVQHLVRRTFAADSPLIALLPGAKSAMGRMNSQQLWTMLCLGLWLERRPECLINLS
ncbi:MAG: asparagine synthase (glutamine-hydrolyzing) [Candidatus Marsarchaeota archaeon]|nr:asparagine synthase (glutamine-hydrolyzing) [Candidatus Marsarchaeota archaeon]